MEKYDVCIIGGGVLGCLIAMELSKSPLSVILTEKNSDTCLEISKANTAVLYPGYDQKPGTLKSRFTIEGNRITADVCEELGVPVMRCGSLMAATGDAGKSVLLKKFRKGTDCGISGLRMLDREETLRLEPCLSPEITAALFAPSTSVIYPWRLGMAAIRQAEKAGVTVKLRTKICEIHRNTKDSEEYLLTAEDGTALRASCVINAAGIHAHQIRELLFPPKIRIRPSMADYLIFGREDNPGLSHVVFYEPEDGKKGISLVPNLNGTLLLGTTDRALPPGIYSGRSSSSPNSTDNLQTARVTDTGTTFLSPDPSTSQQAAHSTDTGTTFLSPDPSTSQQAAHSTDTGTTFSSPDPSTSQQAAHAADTETIFIEPEHATDRAGLQFLQNRLQEICPALTKAVPIRCFAGVRPNPYETIPDGQGGYCDSGRSIHTFIIEKETPDGSFISLLGIKTPGITASVPIAAYVAGIAVQALQSKKPTLHNIAEVKHTNGSVLPDNPTFRTALRDLSLSEKNRLAVQDPSYGKVVCRCEQVTEGEIRQAVRDGASTVEGVKLRCGAGMGRCQGTRCRCAVEKLLEEKREVLQNREIAHPQIFSKKFTQKFEQVPAQEFFQEAVQTSVQEPLQKFVQEPAQKSLQKFVQESEQKSLQKFVQEPAQKSLQKFVQEPAQKSLQEFVQEPAQKSMQKFVQKPEQKSVQKFMQTLAPELICDYLLIGAGVAGLSLAAELARQDPSASIVLADRETYPGGVLVQCLHEGFPAPQPGRNSLSQIQGLSEGFSENLTNKMMNGPDYLDLLWAEVQEDIEAGRIRCLFGTDVTEIKEQKDTALHPVHAVAAAGGTWIRIRAGCAALACGAIERTAGMLRIPGTRPQGIYTAGEVQKMLNLENRLPGRKAVLVGSGNMGLIMADLMLRKGMDVVRILEKEDHVTASAWNIKKYLTDPDSLIRPDRILFQHEVGRIFGAPKLLGISVRRTDPVTETHASCKAVDRIARDAKKHIDCDTKNRIACDAEDRIDCDTENHIDCDTEDRIDCDTLVLAAGLLPDRQLLTDSGFSPYSGTGKRIFSFGNCEHIYTMVSAIRLDAEKAAKNMIRVKTRKHFLIS